MASHEERLAEAIAGAIQRATAPLLQRLAALEADRLTFVGVWREQTMYKAGDVVQRRGLWRCLRNGVTAPPGTDTSVWLLLVKERRG
jgi:hypothetical protein